MTTPLARDLLILLAVSTTYLVIQSQLMVPPPMDDQLNYFTTAAELPPEDPRHQESRIGLLFPVWLLIQVFGYSEVAYYAVPIVSALLLIAGTYLLGSLVFDRWVGALASLLVVANPYVLWHSSHLLPDLPATAFLTLALGVLIYGCRRSMRTDADGWKVSILFLSAGLLLGVAYLIREFTPVFFGLALLVLVVYRQSWQRWALLAAAAFVPFSVELLWNGLLYGNPLNRLLIVAGHGGGTRRFDPELSAVAGTLWREFLEYDGGEVWIAFAVALGVIPLVNSFLRKDKFGEGWVLYAWVIGIWVFMTALGVLPSLIVGEPFAILRTHKIRYWYPLMPALAVGGIGYIGSLIPTRGTILKSARVIVLGALVAIPAWKGVSDVAQMSIWSGSGADHYERVQELLAEDGERWQTIWAVDDAWRATTRALPMYTRSFWGRQIWDGDMRSLNENAHFQTEEKLDEGLLVFHPRAIGSAVPQGGETPDYVQSPLRSWTTVVVSPNGELAVFDLGHEPATTSLYESGPSSWQVIGLSGWKIEESRLIDGVESSSLELDPRERAFIMDGQAAGYQTPETTGALGSGFARGEFEVASSVGGSVTGSVPAGIPNGHRVTLFCFIYYEDGSREQRLAVAAPFHDELDLVGFVCPPVHESEQPVGVRVGIKAVGAATIEVGDLEIWWERS